ncbi:MAG TPA: chloride channel protein [Candidatus Limnocylindrales bacterium]
MEAQGSTTASTLVSVTGSGSAVDETQPAAGHRRYPIYLHVVVMAIVGGLAVLAWLLVFDAGEKILWGNAFVAANPWVFPFICMPFSLIVGLLVRYRQAPTNVHGSAMDSLMSDPSAIDWRHLPVTIVTPLASLFSGAVLGPEGGIGGIASQLAAWYNDALKVPAEGRARLVFSAVASAYNGLIANPLFTGVLGTELIKDKAVGAATLPSNLIGGAIGFLIFTAVGYPGLGNYLHLQPTPGIQLADVLVIAPLALLGIVLALVAGVFFRVAAAAFGRFDDQVIVRALIGGAIFSVVGVFAPIVMFSGETEVQTLVADPASYGAATLLLMAVVKLALLAVAFKSGFFGGPTFPAIFASVSVALAIGLLFPAARLDVLIAGVMAGCLTVFFKAPFMVILLTAFMLQAGVDLVALIVLAVATVLIVQPFLLDLIAARRAARSGGTG